MNNITRTLCLLLMVVGAFKTPGPMGWLASIMIAGFILLDTPSGRK